MTIYNNINNISEDYTYILASDEIFYAKSELNGIYTYNTNSSSWSSIAKSNNNFDTIYNRIKEFVKSNHQNVNLLDVDEKFQDLLDNFNETETEKLYVGINTNEFLGFPDFPTVDMTNKEEREKQYFVLVFTDNGIYCVFVKTFVIYSKTRISDNFEFNDLEYMSAKKTVDTIYDAISKIEILTIVATNEQNKPSKVNTGDDDNRYTIPAITSPKTNCMYLVYETGIDGDTIDDGLNYHFGLYIYDKANSTTSNKYFKKLDTLTFDIKDYALKTHTHGSITSAGELKVNGTLQKNQMVVTGNDGKIISGGTKLTKVSQLQNDSGYITNADIGNIDTEPNGIIDGSVNLLRGTFTKTGNGNDFINPEQTFHNQTIWYVDNRESSEYTHLNDRIKKGDYNHGDIFTLSFYAKTNNSDAKLFSYIQVNNATTVRCIDTNSSAYIDNSWGDGETQFDIDNIWKKYYVTYEFNTSGSTNVDKPVTFRIIDGADIYLSNIQLERGKVATDYHIPLANVAKTGSYNDLTSKPNNSYTPTVVEGSDSYEIGQITLNDITSSIYGQQNKVRWDTAWKCGNRGNNGTAGAERATNYCLRQEDLSTPFNGMFIQVVFNDDNEYNALIRLNNHGAPNYPLYYHDNIIPRGLIQPNDCWLMVFHDEKWHLISREAYPIVKNANTSAATFGWSDRYNIDWFVPADGQIYLIKFNATNNANIGIQFGNNPGYEVPIKYRGENIKQGQIIGGTTHMLMYHVGNHSFDGSDYLIDGDYWELLDNTTSDYNDLTNKAIDFVQTSALDTYNYHIGKTHSPWNGMMLLIKFHQTNSRASPSMAMYSIGYLNTLYPIYYQGSAIPANFLKTNEFYIVVFMDNKWHIINKDISYTPTITNSSANSYEIGKIKNNNVDTVIYGKDTTYSDATTTTSGLMSANDKTQLKALEWSEPSTNKIIIDIGADNLYSGRLAGTSFKYNSILRSLSFEDVGNDSWMTGVLDHELGTGDWAQFAHLDVDSNLLPAAPVVISSGWGTNPIQLKLETNGKLYYRRMNGTLAVNHRIKIIGTFIWTAK